MFILIEAGNAVPCKQIKGITPHHTKCVVT